MDQCTHMYTYILYHMKNMERQTGIEYVSIEYVSVSAHVCMSDSVTLWTAACQAPLSTGILQARILERLPCPSLQGTFSTQEGAHTHTHLLPVSVS